jgi:hypothetical protein
MEVVRGSLPFRKPGTSPVSTQDQNLAIHELVLTGMGCIFSVVIGSFYIYHCYLVTSVPFLRSSRARLRSPGRTRPR